MLAEYFDETIDVRLVVIDMRADAQAAETRRNENILGGKPRDELWWHSARKAQA